MPNVRLPMAVVVAALGVGGALWFIRADPFDGQATGHGASAPNGEVRPPVAGLPNLFSSGAPVPARHVLIIHLLDLVAEADASGRFPPAALLVRRLDERIDSLPGGADVVLVERCEQARESSRLYVGADSSPERIVLYALGEGALRPWTMTVSRSAVLLQRAVARRPSLTAESFTALARAVLGRTGESWSSLVMRPHDCWQSPWP